MRKLKEKLSFLTKIMLVVGLLISNLSSLSVVFAYEATGAVQITVVDEKLNVKYTDELAEEVEAVNVNVYENYTYLDNTSEEELVSNYSYTSEEFVELMSLEGLELESILSSVVFDGLYEVKVEITDGENEVIDSAIYSENVMHDSGLVVSVLDSNNVEIVALEDGSYPVTTDNSKVTVVAHVLAGGLNPTDIFVYEEEEYMAADLLTLEFASEMEFNGRLFGDYIIPVEVKLLNSNEEEVVYSDSLNVLYESYAKNAELLNATSVELGLDASYEFESETAEGTVYVLLNEEKINTMLDLYNIVSTRYADSETVAYVLSNDEYEDVLSSYDVTSELTVLEYLDTIVLDDTAVLTLVNEGLTVTYNVVVTGDLNDDNALTEEDLLELVNQVVGETEVSVEKSDLNGDAVVDTLDVMYLNQVLQTNSWDVVLEESEATLGASLNVMSEDIVSGDTFTVNYVLTVSDYAVNGVAGLFSYDDTMLRLVSVETANEWLGNSSEGKFLYLGTESLTGTVVENEDGTTTVTANEYVVVTATFEALKSGTTTVTVETPEYFDGVNYLVVADVVATTEVVINASDNNNLSSLTVAGQVIELVEDVLDYEITVGNDVTTADVEAIVENVAANVTSVVFPEELAEGTNTVTITVTSESGNEKVYTITVIREEAPEEETTTTQVSYNNNYNNNVEQEEEEEVVTPSEEEDDDDDVVEEESNLSRIVIIILILLVIAGLIYLIFKDEDDEETKKTNKDINKLKKDDVEITDKTVTKIASKSTSKPTNKSGNAKTSNSKNKNSSNKKKER